MSDPVTFSIPKVNLSNKPGASEHNDNMGQVSHVSYDVFGWVSDKVSVGVDNPQNPSEVSFAFKSNAVPLLFRAGKVLFTRNPISNKWTFSASATGKHGEWKSCDPEVVVNIIISALKICESSCEEGDQVLATRIRTSFEASLKHLIDTAPLYEKANDCRVPVVPERANVGDNVITWD